MAIESIQKMKWPYMAMLLTIAFALWLPDLMAGIAMPHDVTLFRLFGNQWHTTVSMATFITMLLTLINAWQLTQLTFRLNISQTTNFLPFILYCLTCSAFHKFHLALDLQLTGAMYFILIRAMLEAWHNSKQSEIGLRCGLICVLCSFIAPHSLYLLPLMFLCMLMQEGMSPRMLMGMLIGYSIYFYPLLLPYAMPSLTIDVDLLAPFYKVDFQLQSWSGHEYFYILMGALLIAYLIMYFRQSFDTHIHMRIRAFNHGLLGFFVIAMVEMFFVDEHGQNCLESLIPICCVFMFSQVLLMSRKDSRKGWLFYILLALLAANAYYEGWQY